MSRMFAHQRGRFSGDLVGDPAAARHDVLSSRSLSGLKLGQLELSRHKGRAYT